MLLMQLYNIVMAPAGRCTAVWFLCLAGFSFILYHFQIRTHLEHSLRDSSTSFKRSRSTVSPLARNNNSSSPPSSSVPVCTSQQRLNYIRQQYRKYNMTSHAATAAAASSLVVNDKKRMAYCFIPKCGSNTMKRFMAILTGNAKLRELLGNIHSPKRLAHFGLRLVSTDDIHTISDYRKFVVIRHPLDRFLSAFHHVVLNRNSSANSLKLVQFIELVVNGTNNKHWDPFAARCNFQFVDYDDVIRIETFRHDVKALLEYTNSNFSVLLRTSKHHYRRESTKASDVVDEPLVRPKYLQEFSDVSTNDLIELKKFYKNDLRLFGYEFDGNTLVASCSMTDERSVTCC